MRPVNLGIAGDAVRPRALGIDEIDRPRPDTRPRILIGQGGEDAFGEALRLVRREEVARLAVANQFAMAADARSDDDPLLRHRLERLQRRHQLGQPHRDTREHEEVRQIVVSLYLLMRDPSREDDALAKVEFLGQSTQVALFGAATDEAGR